MGSGISSPNGDAFSVAAIENSILTSENRDFAISKEYAHTLLLKYKEMEEKLSCQGDVYFAYCLQNSRKSSPSHCIGIIDPVDIIQKLKTEKSVSSNRELRSSKLFVCFVSSEFALDNKLVGDFEYARLLTIPVLCVIVGNGHREWAKSPVGLLMADELYIDMTDAALFESKFVELSTRV